MVLVASLAVLALVVGATTWLSPNIARGDEGDAGANSVPTTQEAPPRLLPTEQQTKEALQESNAEHGDQPPVTDPQVAEELPHRDLDGEEAFELTEGVFGAQLEAPAGIYDELEPEKFLSDNAAIVPASTLPEPAGEQPGEGPAYEPVGGVAGDQPVLIESSLPLRTENAEGKEEAVDLSLESPEGSGGELQPGNPLAEVAIPAHIGEGISVGDVQIAVAGAPQERAPTNVEEQFAFYPNVAENTDLVVSPTPTGVETMTTIRSAEAPTTTTYELSMPSGAELKASGGGGAEVVKGDRTTMRIPPPTATDAAGEPVAVGLEVAGTSLRVVASPDAATAYPILVDPEFISEESTWAAPENFAAWSSNTSQWSLCPVPYARWIGPSVPGLGLTSHCDNNPVPSGTVADWYYTVPRYGSDIANFGSPPTSFVFQLQTKNVVFEPYGNGKAYPVLLWGLISPTTGWGEHITHYGTQGAIGWSETPFYSTNAAQEPQYKAAGMYLETFENESPAVLRDTYIGSTMVAVEDTGPPVLKELVAPTKWLNTTAEPIKYSVEDTGLGVKAAWASYEAEPEPGWGFELPCAGTAVHPCPRVAKSGETPLTYDPKALPTGKDRVIFAFDDVAFAPSGGGGNHVTGGIATLKIDHTAPEVTLTGALTEQEKLGTLKTEYPLNIKAVDGTEADPQSGVAKVEVKVDGKAKQTWSQGCATEDCAFSNSWTLKTSEYTAASHEVEVLVTDAAGVVSEETIEVDLGESPPQTSFTSPHPTYEGHEIPTVAFKATLGGKPVEGATFKCSLGKSSETPTKACTSPFELPLHLEPGWHVLNVEAINKAGKADPTPATWKFEAEAYPPAPSSSEKMVYPETGKTIASYYTLEAEWGNNPEGKAAEGVTGVTFQMQLPGKVKNERGEEVPKTFETVPAECVIDGEGHQVTWPLRPKTHPGHNAPVYLKVRGCPVFEEARYPEKEIEFRAVYDGGAKVAGASPPVATEFVYNTNTNRVPTDATEEVGPASVDLLTGAFTLSRTDVSVPVPGYEANLEFTRVYHSSADGKLPGTSQVLGGAWQPSSPLESEGEGEAWTKIEEVIVPRQEAVYGYYCWTEPEEEWEEGGELFVGPVEHEAECPASHECHPEWCEKWEEEPEQPEMRWIELFDNEGAGVPFEIAGTASEPVYVSPEWAKELKLYKEAGNFVLAYPNGTHTTFVTDGEGHFVPRYISYQATPGSMRMFYEMHGKELRLEKEIAPAPVECPEATSHTTPGCRTLIFNYAPHALAGGGSVTLLESITYWGPTGNPKEAQIMAVYGYAEVATPSGGRGFVLTGEADVRLPTSSTELYAYAASPYTNELTSVTDSGVEPWNFNYEYNATGNPTQGEKPTRLKSVTQAGATTTIAYEVPVKGAGAPYAMGPETVATWGQTDLPVDATAIFPPNHVPSGSPPSSYTGATVHYLDPEGHQVNMASPSPPGVSGPSITTTETDMKGNVVRELSPRGRLLALESPESATLSHQLDSHSVYNANGTEMLESWGPLHQVRLESGESVQAREHTVTRYDEGEPLPPAGTPPAYLPTKETVATVVPGREGELEPTVTETRYDWPHRLPKETIVDPGGLNIRSVTEYNAAGQVIEARQPKGAAGGTAGDTKTIYYSATGSGECLGIPQYANLPCKVVTAAQASGTGRPQLLVKKIAAYDYLGQPTLVTENPANEPAEVRATLTVYDSAGRQVSAKVTGGGTALARTEAKSETLYNTTTGAPIKQQFVCEKGCTGFNSQATTTTYNALGQVTEYEDADGGKTKTTYDTYGRPVSVTDGKGTQTFHYDETSGVLTSVEVSGVGTFTAAYDAEGDLIRRGLPNGLTANTTYNIAGEPTKLTYTKTSSCGSSCTWFEETLERSAEGQILADASSLVSNHYEYDNAGRLTEATETPIGGQCTSRGYKYDADSNRLAKTTRTGVGGLCTTTGGTTQSYTYDEADRLIGPTYDAFGRITSLPAEFAGGKALTTEYFANDMVAKQTQNGVSNTFQLDSTGRQRQREQVGGVAGVEIFHYAGPGDSLSWTALGSTWSRNVSGVGGELVAVQESSGTTTFTLTDLHGDVVGWASSSPTATALLGTSRFSEFGEPQPGATAGRFGWLGGNSRRTELSSGVIQMGARSYVPSLGRFLTPDPVPGGSANPYDYANQDPVNAFDLDGNCSTKKKCAAQAKKAKKQIQHRLSVIRQSMRKGRTERQRKSPTRLGTYGGIPITLPWEHQVNAVLGGIETGINDLLGHSCLEKSETFGAIAGISKGGSGAIKAATKAAPALKIAGYLTDVSEASAFLGGVFFLASRAHVC
jgi:RHS repeat-associated protein